MDYQDASKLRIAFVMPEISPRPIGGAKRVYRYADGLAARGHSVTLVHPQESLLTAIRYEMDFDPDFAPLGNVHEMLDDTKSGIAYEPLKDPHPWYISRPDVRNLVVPSLAEEGMDGPYDVTIVIHRQLVPWAQAYSPQMGKIIYFLLDYESYMWDEPARRERARQTLLRIDWPIVCSSLVIQQLVKSVAGRRCRLIPAAIDTSIFQVSIPIDSDKRTLIGFPARTERTKRTWDAVRALELLRPHISPHITFWCFGYERIPAIPDWITHYAAPSDAQLCELYNRSKVFLVPSDHEGFGLPGAEAMACGVALVSTRNGGVETYAVGENSALLVPRRDPMAMAEAIGRLMDHEKLRRRIASNGARSVRRWTWDQAIAEFERFIGGEGSDEAAPA